MGKHKIYGLRVIGQENFRYIGYTKRKLGRRLYHHFYDVKAGETWKKCQWIKKHNFNIEIVLIEGDLTYKEALVREKYWIKKHKTYLDGMNMTKGGDKNPMECPDVRAKHREKMATIGHKLAHYGDDNWMTTDAGKEWFKGNNPMHNKVHIETHRKAMDKLMITVDKDELKKKYIKEGKTLKECADYFNVSYYSIIKNLKRNKIRKYKKPKE